MPKGLNRASYQIETVRGLVGNSWKHEGERFEMTTIVPIGCTVYVFLTYQEGKQWMESNAPLKETEYMKIDHFEEYLGLELTSGTHHFTNY